MDLGQLTARDFDLAAFWQEAALDLGIHVTAPFEISGEPTAILFAAHVGGIGTSGGLVCRAMIANEGSSPLGLQSVPSKFDFCYMETCWVNYDRASVIEFLNFFAWTGLPAERLDWHVGPIDYTLQSSDPMT